MIPDDTRPQLRTRAIFVNGDFAAVVGRSLVNGSNDNITTMIAISLQADLHHWQWPQFPAKSTSCGSQLAS